MSNFSRGGAKNIIAIAVMVIITLMGTVMIGNSIFSMSSQTSFPSNESQSDLQQPNITKPLPDTSMGSSLMQTVMVTLALIGIIIFGARFAKRYVSSKQTGGLSGDIKVTKRRYITPKQSIAIIEVRNKELLVGITDHSINLIYDLTSEEDDWVGPEFAKTPVANDE